MKLPCLPFALPLLALALAQALDAQSATGTLAMVLPSSATGVAVQGNMFDVENINPVNSPPVNVCCLGVNCAAPTKSSTNWSVFRKTTTGTWSTAANTISAWTLVGTAANVTSAGPGALTPLPIPINVAITAGTTQAFFVYETSPGGGSGGVVSPAGVAPGGAGGVPAPGVWGPNGPNLRVREGCGRGVNGNRFLGVVVGGPGSMPALTRNFSGSITYGPPVYQIDSGDATSNIDGKEGTSCCKAVTEKDGDGICSFGDSITMVNFISTQTFQPWDLAVTSAPAVPVGNGGFATPGGQFFNLDLTDPAAFFLNGASFGVAFPGNFSIPFQPGAPFEISGQFIIVAPNLIDTVALSQPNDYHATLIAPPSNPLPPVGDDAAATFNFQATCGSCACNFYGVSYTEFGVTTNGRVMFGGSSTSFSASVSNALLAPGTLGVWCDLNQALGGHIAVGANAQSGVAQVDWVNVPYFNQPGTINSFNVQMDTLSGIFTIGGLMGIGPGTGNQFLGVSQGAGATDPGQASFSSGFHPAPPLPTDMVYRFGPEGTLSPGANHAVFSPAGPAGIGYDLSVF